jgi:hypothetical protein
MLPYNKRERRIDNDQTCGTKSSRSANIGDQNYSLSLDMDLSKYRAVSGMVRAFHRRFWSRSTGG